MGSILQDPVTTAVFLALAALGLLMARSWWRASHRGVYLIAFLLPFQFMLPWSSDLWVSFVTIGAFVLFAIAVVRLLTEKEDWLTSTTVWGAIYLLVVLMSCIISEDPLEVYTKNVKSTMWLLIVYLAVVGNVLSSSQVRGATVALILGALAISLYGLMDFYTHGRMYDLVMQLGLDELIFRREVRAYQLDRNRATFINPDYYGAMLNYSYALALGIFLSVTGSQRLLAGAGTLLLGFSVFATGGRSAMAGTLAATATAFSLYVMVRRGGWRSILTALLAIIAGAILFFLFKEGLVWELLGKTADWQGKYSVNSVYRSLSLRLALWSGALEYFRERPMLGWGITPQVTAYGWTVHPHNWYFKVLTTTGALGLLSMMGVIVSAARCALSVFLRAKDNWEEGISLGILAALAAFGIDGIANDAIREPKTGMTFWCIVALAGILQRIHRQEAQAYETTRQHAMAWRKVTLGSIMILAPAMALAIIYLGELTYIAMVPIIAIILVLGSMAMSKAMLERSTR